MKLIELESSLTLFICAHFQFVYVMRSAALNPCELTICSPEKYCWTVIHYHKEVLAKLCFSNTKDRLVLQKVKDPHLYSLQTMVAFFTWKLWTQIMTNLFLINVLITCNDLQWPFSTTHSQVIVVLAVEMIIIRVSTGSVTVAK